MLNSQSENEQRAHIFDRHEKNTKKSNAIDILIERDLYMIDSDAN